MVPSGGVVLVRCELNRLVQQRCCGADMPHRRCICRAKHHMHGVQLLMSVCFAAACAGKLLLTCQSHVTG